ncbi:MAG: hypothetical protein NTX35_20670, partial [Verrucomicrobia bacterium]|nr:hypothetical protein [Verrucomicrobiota bacterium]
MAAAQTDATHQTVTSTRYDAAGNRRRIHSDFTDGAATSPPPPVNPEEPEGPGDPTRTVADHWYRYDRENRITLAEGKLIGTAGTAGATTDLDRDNASSAWLEYDAIGNRRRDTRAAGSSGFVYLGYDYDAGNRLIASYTSGSVTSRGTQTGGKVYDGAGRVVSSYGSFSDTGATALGGKSYSAASQSDSYFYNLNGQLLEQRHLQNGSLQYAVGYYSNGSTTKGTGANGSDGASLA